MLCPCGGVLFLIPLPFYFPLYYFSFDVFWFFSVLLFFYSIPLSSLFCSSAVLMYFTPRLASYYLPRPSFSCISTPIHPPAFYILTIHFLYSIPLPSFCNLYLDILLLYSTHLHSPVFYTINHPSSFTSTSYSNASNLPSPVSYISRHNPLVFYIIPRHPSRHLLLCSIQNLHILLLYSIPRHPSSVSYTLAILLLYSFYILLLYFYTSKSSLILYHAVFFVFF